MESTGKMATRRNAREWAVQALFSLDLNPRPPGEALAEVTAECAPEPETLRFAERLLSGTCENRERIDETLKRYAENWDLHRMGVVERSVLRMAVYEMWFCHDIPPVVSINEAVDIAKYFSSADSGRFVNGLLDRIRADLGRPARRASKGPGNAGAGP